MRLKKMANDYNESTFSPDLPKNKDNEMYQMLLECHMKVVIDLNQDVPVVRSLSSRILMRNWEMSE